MIKLPTAVTTSMSNVSKYAKHAYIVLKDNSATILQVMGMCQAGVTVVFAIRETPDAHQAIQDAKKKKEDDLTVWETFSTAAPYYKKTAVSGALTEVFLAGSLIKNNKDKAALTSAALIAEDRFRKLQDKEVEMLGPAKAAEIRDSVVQDRVDEETSDDRYTYATGRGNQLCRDGWMNRPFYGSRDALETAKADALVYLAENGFMSLNTFYEFAHLPTCSAGENIGWAKGRDLFDIVYTAGIDKFGRTYLEFNFFNDPMPDFTQWY